ncbi:NADP-dependent oxidoreductase domain-containing protein [Ampelomyces quisqualis]|uniref:NADP-dependent oxidoreductase domain-containing protein n=1 Tax=Ampelomyces quisqualis TaxID=50730 RepID=A0A6A5QIN4_AMPQU|nr:NADP-dependent oxidoreductase domain-containing protein [Ampelomyces quisqualis]
MCTARFSSHQSADSNASTANPGCPTLQRISRNTSREKLNRLDFTPDLYYLHRIDPSTPLEESIPALDALRKAGKTKYIGLSESSARTLRCANETEYSAFETIHEIDGLIDAARKLGVAYVASSTLGHSWLVDYFDYFYANKAIVQEIKKLENAKSASSLRLRSHRSLAAQGFNAIPGTTKSKRLEEHWAGRDIELSEEVKKEISGIVDKAKVGGDGWVLRSGREVGVD